MNILLIGKRGTGKTTVATLLSENFKYEKTDKITDILKTGNLIYEVDKQSQRELLKELKNEHFVSFLIKTNDNVRRIRIIQHGEEAEKISKLEDIDKIFVTDITDDDVDCVIDNNTSNPWKAVDRILEKVNEVERY